MGPSVSLRYGHGTLPVRLPAGAAPTVIRKRALAPLAEPAGAIGRALDGPVGGAPLAERARGARSACILVCDVTRPVPNGLFLRPVIERVLAAGVPAGAITVLIATGLHRPNEGDELRGVIGDPWVFDHATVVNHDARDEAAHADLGRTDTGTPIRIDRRFVAAELRIATGLVEPHFMAGWSGGRKVVAPGVAGHDTIRTFHSARFMEDPAATQCRLDGNPLHREQLAIVRRIGAISAVNTIVDEERRLVHVNFGDIEPSHAAAVAVAERAARVAVGRRFATVLTSNAGFPLDRTYYQTVKGMVTPLDILQPGGTLLMASECGEGLGSAAFRRSQERLVAEGPDAFLRRITAKSLADIDEWQTEMQLRSQRVGAVALHTTGLDATDRALTGVGDAPDLDAAVAAAVARDRATGGDGAVAVIPEGPYVVPVAAAA